MTPEQWQQAREILADALELKPEDRPAFLDRTCSSDRHLRQEIERMLASSDEVRSTFLQSSTFHVGITPGTRLGEYEVQTLIGSGGMGEVYRARDTSLGREVAIKVLPPALSHDPDRLRRFEQEARAAAALTHPNILAVHQMGTYEGAPYLVSELLEGSTLRGLLVRGPMPVRIAIDYGVQIARGLAAAHEKGITHRDLKPENLFVTKDGHVKILDFGLAKLTQPRTISDQSAPTISVQTEPGVVMGTVGYMSPEQVRGSSTDCRTDIFAFGAILYEMLTGKRAFQKATSAETMSAILNEDPPSISQIAPSIPLSIERAVHRCLEKNFERRFQSASDMAFALESSSDSRTGWQADGALHGRKIGVVIAISTVLLGSAVILWREKALSPPAVESVIQLTNDGQPKPVPTVMASDGSRLYFQERRSGSLEIEQVSVAGGETAPVSVSGLASPEVLDVAPDFSALLIRYGTQDNSFVATLPLPIGQPRKIVKADSAAFFPDGRRLVYCAGNSIFIADIDGSNVRKIPDVGGSPSWPSVSPNGRRIRFGVSSLSDPFSIWEVEAEGTQLHPRRILSGSPGRWTTDGRFYIFTRWEDRRNLWALPEKHGLFSRSPAEPIRLTSGPLNYGIPLPSRDGKQIFAVGFQNRGELIRYDSASKQFLPANDGISVTDVTYSADGKWMVYRSYPDCALWRSRADGSDRLQLTYNPPISIFYPRISSDAKHVAFVGRDEHGFQMAYVIDTLGGEARPIQSSSWLPLAWSPDGKSLVMNVLPNKSRLDPEAMPLATLDLESGRLSVIPGSESKFSAVWPRPDMIVAMGAQDKLYSFDMTNQKWSVLADGPISNSMVSPDSKYLYFIRETPGNPQAMRVRLADRKVEAVASVRGLRRVSDSSTGGETWMGVSPDGSVLLTRDIGTQEIYAVNVNWP